MRASNNLPPKFFRKITVPIVIL